MSKILADFKSAADEGSPGGCKVCSFLDQVAPEDVQIDELIRSESKGKNKISNDKIAAILKTHGTNVGATTVRRHRFSCPPRTATVDTQT